MLLCVFRVLLANVCVQVVRYECRANNSGWDESKLVADLDYVCCIRCGRENGGFVFVAPKETDHLSNFENLPNADILNEMTEVLQKLSVCKTFSNYVTHRGIIIHASYGKKFV